MRAARTLLSHGLLLFLFSLVTLSAAFAEVSPSPDPGTSPEAVAIPAVAIPLDLNVQVDALYERAKAEIDAARLPAAVATLREALSLRAPDPKRSWKVLMALAVACDEMKRPFWRRSTFSSS